MKHVLELIKYKFFTKINNNYITFMSFGGKYADSPKFLTSYIHEIDQSKKIIWLVNDVNDLDIPDYVTKVKYGTKEAWDYYCKSKVIIDNVYGLHETYLESNRIFSKIKYKLVTFLKNKKGQCVYSTWHGTPLKKIGLDAVNNKLIDFDCANTKMILDNEYAMEILNRITLNKLKMVIFSSAKNDFLLDEKIDIEKLKEKLNLPKSKRIILFAPSFRSNDDNSNNVFNSGLNQINQMNIEKLLKTFGDKFGGDYSLVCRFHYKVENMIDWDELKNKYGDGVINGNYYPDITEYLKCSDVLLTDMSSCFFDFSFLKKPVFLFFPDIEHYIESERGLYINVNDLPYSCSVNFEELISNINKFDQKKYEKEVFEFLKSLGFIIEKDSCSKIAKFILEDSSK